MGLLLVARHQFLWWPFHPLGFLVSHGRGDGRDLVHSFPSMAL